MKRDCGGRELAILCKVALLNKLLYGTTVAHHDDHSQKVIELRRGVNKCLLGN